MTIAQKKYKIVVPKPYRQEILCLAHETSMGGHLGTNKTYHKIWTQFYWPKIKSDVSKFCRSCQVCQVVGKQNQNNPKAHLKPIPAFEKPLSRVVVDSIDPLPKTMPCNQNLLTIKRLSTNISKEIPLRNFAQFGLLKFDQFGQRSELKPGVFQLVTLEYGIQQFKSKVKLWFHQCVLERICYSCNKVHSLLQILHKFLQLRFYGPYKVKKKMN